MCFGPEKFVPEEWLYAHAAKSSVVVFEKYNPCTDYHSGAEIDKLTNSRHMVQLGKN